MEDQVLPFMLCVFLSLYHYILYERLKLSDNTNFH